MQDDLRPVRIYCKMKQRTERMNTMDWTEVAITVDAADVDRAGDIAQMVVPYGIYICLLYTSYPKACSRGRCNTTSSDGNPAETHR